MTSKNLKLMSAGLIVAVAFGVTALRVARATPPQGVTATLVAGPVALDEADVKSNHEGLKIKIQTRGDWVSRKCSSHPLIYLPHAQSWVSSRRSVGSRAQPKEKRCALAS